MRFFKSEIILLLLPLVSALSQPLTFERFARDLVDLESLTQVAGAPTRMDSSWDRAGGNNDAFLGKRRKGDLYTVADLHGPSST